MATFNFNKVNLAAAQIPSAITASQTSITVDASESALFPTVPFFATIIPAGGVPNTLNSEIVQVTAVNTSTGVLTITRAQRSTTAKAQDEGAVIMNGVYIEDLAQAQAVGLAFFSATNVSVSSSYSYWDIDNAMLPTAPTNGMSIRVVFGADTSGPAAQLRLNGGTYRNVYAGVGLTATASNVNTTTPFNPKSGIIYELVYYNNAWYAMNVPANNSITSDNVDWTTFIDKIYPVGSIYMSANNVSPQSFMGGTWVAWGSGRVPVGVDASDSDFNTVEKTGGSKNHTHPLGVNGAAAVRNYANRTYVGDGANANSLWKMDGVANQVWSWTHNTDAAYANDLGYSGVRLYGRTETTKNLPPYITCYMWKRTA